jgi:hypothetical protein
LLVVTVVTREGSALVPVELSVVEQRYPAVISLVPVTEVRALWGVAEDGACVVRRYESEGLAGLADCHIGRIISHVRCRRTWRRRSMSCAVRVAARPAAAGVRARPAGVDRVGGATTDDGHDDQWK